MSGTITLILGGARSGKSDWAERLAAQSGRPVVFVATATADDAEMAERIATHRAARPATWRTVEAPLTLADTVVANAHAGEVVLIDCLTLWVSNVILRQVPDGSDIDLVPRDRWQAIERHLLKATEELLDTTLELGASLVLVSNEVGMGLVPPYQLGRRYRDILGRVNRAVAQRADSVVLMIAGLPVDVRQLVVAEFEAGGKPPMNTEEVTRRRSVGGG